MCSFIGYLLVRFGSVNQMGSLLCGNRWTIHVVLPFNVQCIMRSLESCDVHNNSCLVGKYIVYTYM